MRIKFTLLLSVFLLVSCASPTPEPTVTPLPSPTLTVAPTSTRTPELLTPTAPAGVESDANAQKIAEILETLDLSESDHESYADANYRIETREWQGQQVRMLIHDDSRVEGERIDAMEVTINGKKQWVRGAYYPVEGYGGMVVDVIVHPVQEQRAFFTTPEVAQAVYGELLTAIAHQKGMSEQGLANYLSSHENKIEIVLPEFVNLDNHSKNRSPSYLQASEPVIVDLSKPVVYASRTGSYIDQEVAPGVTVPDGIRWVVGDSDAGIAVFVANEQLFVVYEFERNLTADHPGTVGSRMYRALEMIARMKIGFVDTLGVGNSLLETTGRVSGINYYDGATIINRDVLFKPNKEFTDYEYINFMFK